MFFLEFCLDLVVILVLYELFKLAAKGLVSVEFASVLDGPLNPVVAFALELVLHFLLYQVTPMLGLVPCVVKVMEDFLVVLDLHVEIVLELLIFSVLNSFL